MNKYLEKVAEILSDENKHVAKTFSVQTAAGIPAHLVGGAIGGKLGTRFLGNAASNINHGIGRIGDAVGKAGKIGAWAGKHIHGSKGISGNALGVGLGMSAVGGLADLAALKHGFHQKGKRNE